MSRICARNGTATQCKASLCRKGEQRREKSPDAAVYKLHPANHRPGDYKEIGRQHRDRLRLTVVGGHSLCIFRKGVRAPPGVSSHLHPCADGDLGLLPQTARRRALPCSSPLHTKDPPPHPFPSPSSIHIEIDTPSPALIRAIPSRDQKPPIHSCLDAANSQSAPSSPHLLRAYPPTTDRAPQSRTRYSCYAGEA
ncbi:hypothetical protein VTK73DRAFT_6288 [Phialemonium thermophilum]|uniref:Uncharacterized protein n=1 Tax=Phialemonium thermophilum TaxID=223376 RepID=A0ABR3UZR7_9PEZI